MKYCQLNAINNEPATNKGTVVVVGIVFGRIPGRPINTKIAKKDFLLQNN